MTERRPKQVLVIRRDLNMRKGKIASAAAHASLKVFLDSMSRAHTTHRSEDPSLDQDCTILSMRYERRSATGHWLDGEFTKICVSVNSEAELLALRDRAVEAMLPHALIRDAGHTEFHGVPTYTALAIGPGWEDELDPITGSLPLL